MLKIFKTLMISFLCIIAISFFSCESNTIAPLEQTDIQIDTHVDGKPCFVFTIWTEFGSTTFYSLHIWTSSKERLIYILNTDSAMINISMDELDDFDIQVGRY